MVDIYAIHGHQKQLTRLWHATTPEVKQDGFRGLIEANHLNNFSLWHEEDKARREDMGHEFVYQAKRAIDRFNQQRNNFMEKIDQLVVSQLPAFDEKLPSHTETPGMMIDRLSILTLKEYHMWEETERQDVGEDHRSRCAQKLSVIQKQIADLQAAFQYFWNEVIAGKKKFNVYFQFKMYNDPSLNPQLYKLSKK